MKRLFFIIGPPGIGKTTIILRTVETLKEKGLKVGGMLSREVRQNGIRVGFEIIDLETGRKGWLAHVNQSEGPRVGKYHVNLKDLETFGAGSIRNAVSKAQIIVVDEVGPMELHSHAFKDAVIQVLNSDKPSLGVIYQSARDPLIEQLRKRGDAEILEVTRENRDSLHNVLIVKISQFFAEKPMTD